MRIGDDTIMRTMLSDLNRLLGAQYQTQRDISTGRLVNAPSDDPEVSLTVMSSRYAMQVVAQYSTNLESANTWLGASESSMQSIVDLLNRASVLAEQMATGTIDDLERLGASYEVDNIINQLITLANTNIHGNYIFGGTQTQTQPINSLLVADNPGVLTADSTYGHDATASYSEIAPGDWRLALSRDTAGNPITIGASTLGAALGLNFNPAFWTTPPPGDVATHNSNLGGPGALVSNRIGETLSFTADGAAQTITTTGMISFSGVSGATNASVDLDTGAGPPFPLTYNATGSTDAELAASMAEAINSDVTPGSDYYAWVENGNEVHIMATAGAVVDMTPNTAPGTGTMTVDQTTSVEELTDMLNYGARATGMLHLDDATLPLDTDTITVGDQTVAWADVFPDPANPPTTAAGYASALTDWINANTTGFEASTSASGTGASIRVGALTVGLGGNAALSSSTVDVLTSPGLTGGSDGSGTASQGAVYGLGESDLRLSTTVQATVMETDGDAVELMLRWYDDDGELNSQVVSLAGRGESNAVAVAGLGGLEIFVGNHPLYSGATFDLNLTHYQGNDEDLAINFSEHIRMDYNWTAQELLGDNMTVNLLGSDAVAAAANTGAGVVSLAGAYRGVTSREITLDVIDPGTVPGDDVILRASWIGDDKLEHIENITVSANGFGSAIEIPGCDGVSIYLDTGNFDQGDSFTVEIEKEPVHLLDTLYQWSHMMRTGDLEEGQTESQRALDAIAAALEPLLDQVATAGIRQERILTREMVIMEQELYHSGQLSELQEVDLTEAMMKLQLTQTAYNTALKVASVLAELSLVNQLD